MIDSVNIHNKVGKQNDPNFLIISLLLHKEHPPPHFPKHHNAVSNQELIRLVTRSIRLFLIMNYEMEDSQNAAPGHATVHEASKLSSSSRRQDTQSVTKR